MTKLGKFANHIVHMRDRIVFDDAFLACGHNDIKSTFAKRILWLLIQLEYNVFLMS